ncbi:hypothetical protein JW979_16330 [bacterium]|nr:hypothetical protein [candidate division CSSED10-310 bacterium]
MKANHFYRMLFCFITVFISISPSVIFAASDTITYQGTIADPSGDPIADSTYPMEFSIWDASSAGGELWTETGHTVSVVKGAFAVELGLTTPIGSIFDSGASRWLEIAADLGAGMQTFSPRVPLTSVPWALKTDYAAIADDADTLDGFHSSAFVPKHTGAIYRWATFSTYHNGYGWLLGNDSAMFGGVHPSNWTDANYRAYQMSPDKEVLRTIFTRKGYAGMNATVMADVFHDYSSTNGRVVMVLFRIKNMTENSISWTPQFKYTCYGSFNEFASATLNGADSWYDGGNCYNCSASLPLDIPASRTSTVIFVATSGPTGSTGTSISIRSLVLAFTSNSLLLPPGLEYVDDLDTATGGWEQ